MAKVSPADLIQRAKTKAQLTAKQLRRSDLGHNIGVRYHNMRGRQLLEDPNQLKTVAMMIGTFRSLTTMTAGALALHPNIQVLNHGGPAILTDPRLNPFLEDPKAVDRFITYALGRSLGGERGTRGGSILLSHALDDGPLLDAYKQRYGMSRAKSDIKCLAWKACRPINTYLFDNDLTGEELLTRDQRIRYLLPIRFPLDTAESAQRMSRFTSPETIEETAADIVYTVGHGLTLADRAPEKVFVFWQDTNAQDLGEGLVRTLQLPHDKEWQQDLEDSVRIRKSRYDHSSQLVDHYHQCVDALTDVNPDHKTHLHELAAL